MDNFEKKEYWGKSIQKLKEFIRDGLIYSNMHSINRSLQSDLSKSCESLNQLKLFYIVLEGNPQKISIFIWDFRWTTTTTHWVCSVPPEKFHLSL